MIPNQKPLTNKIRRPKWEEVAAKAEGLYDLFEQAYKKKGITKDQHMKDARIEFDKLTSLDDGSYSAIIEMRRQGFPGTVDELKKDHHFVQIIERNKALSAKVGK